MGEDLVVTETTLTHDDFCPDHGVHLTPLNWRSLSHTNYFMSLNFYQVRWTPKTGQPLKVENVV